jgi:type IV secretory pathway VirB10-like protein
MEVEGSAGRSGESWPVLVEDDPSAERTVSPRSLLLRGPVTRPARPARRGAKTRSGSEAVVQPPIRLLPPRPRALDRWWRAGVVTVVASAAAALMIVAGEPAAADRTAAPAAVADPDPASPAIAIAPMPAPSAAPVAAPADPETLVEEVLYIEDDDEPEAEATDDAADADKSARRARAREAARSITSRARERRALGDVAGAEKLYHGALGALPTYGPAAADLATLHIHRGQYRQALAYAKRAARSAPRKLSYMILLGDAHHLMGDRAAAQAQWRRASDYGSAKATDRLAKHAR